MASQSFSSIIADRARREPDTVVVVDAAGATTMAELDRRATRLARALIDLGVARDDLVEVLLPNSTEFIVACVAAWRAGATPMPLDPNMISSERTELEYLARPSVVIGPPGTHRWIPTVDETTVDETTARSDSATPLPDVWPRSWKALATSGSTGRPNIVRTTRPALTDPDLPATSFIPHTATQLITSPLWHSTAFTYGLLGLLTAHRIIIMPQFDETSFLDAVEEHRVTWTAVSPPSIRRLLRLPESDRARRDMSSLETLLHIGGRCPEPDKRALMDWLGPERVIEVYAGSESNGITVARGPEWLDHPGTVGQPLSSTTITIRRADGSAAPTGEIGNIWMRVDAEPLYHYLGAHSRRTADGWDTLGDLGWVDDDGYLYVADRAADIIVRRGSTIYPADIEQILEQHPDVRGAVAFGEPGDDGADTLAVLVDIADAQVSTTALSDHIVERLGPQARPDRITVTHDHIRNDAGKIRRRALMGCGVPARRHDPPRQNGAPTMSASTRVDLTLLGVRGTPPIHRTGGAGPTDDGHLIIDGLHAAIPRNPDSPFVLDGDRILYDGVDSGLDVDIIDRPSFYDLTTEDGVAYEKIAKLHGRNVLATTVVQTCIRYAESQRCRFCSIEESLRSASTVAVKRPEQLAEVARAAVELDGITQMVMTTGTSAGRDRGAKHLARCVRAVKEAVPDLPIQVQCEPPADLSTITELREAGADAIGIHVESLDDAVRHRWMPGKSSVSLDEYRAAWAEAVRVFGRNQVSTYLLVGLGEDIDEMISGAKELADSGVYPFIVPFRPHQGTLAVDVDHATAPDPAIVEKVTREVAEHLRLIGMAGAEQRAGCAACGACSVLQSVGG